MTMTRSRLMSMGANLVWVDLYWDSPMGVEQPDGTVIEGDPSATWIVHDIFFANLSTNIDFRITLAHRVNADLTRRLDRNTPEDQWNLGVGQQPDLRETTILTLSQLNPGVPTGILRSLLRFGRPKKREVLRLQIPRLLSTLALKPPD
jgi:hypothetical protein